MVTPGGKRKGAGRRKWDEQFLCPTLMEGHQMLSVSFSFPRTIERVRKGEWKATAPTFGLCVASSSPLQAEFSLMHAVREAAIARLDPRPSREPSGTPSNTPGPAGPTGHAGPPGDERGSR